MPMDDRKGWSDGEFEEHFRRYNRQIYPPSQPCLSPKMVNKTIPPKPTPKPKTLEEYGFSVYFVF